MVEKFHQTLSECHFMPRNSNLFVSGMSVQLVKIVGLISDDIIMKTKLGNFLGNFRGLVIESDVLGEISRMGEMALTLQTFSIFHKELEIDISDLTIHEFLNLKRSKKIDLILESPKVITK
jgi:hypothetical protein